MVDFIWRFQPAHFRAFIIVAVLAFLLSIFRAYRLAFTLHSSRISRVALQEGTHDSMSLELARGLLANLLTYNQLVTAITAAGERGSAVLAYMDLEFQRLWDECYSVVRSISQTVRFVLLLSF